LIAAAGMAMWHQAAAAPTRAEWSPASAEQLAVPRDSLALANAAREVRDGNPFRHDRRPASARFDPFPAPPNLRPAPAAPPKPVLSLVGVVGGPPWRAIIEGLPGRSGAVVLGTGDTAGGLRLTAVTADSVRIIGLDTAWILTMQGRP
jgi:hypothetical protein